MTGVGFGGVHAYRAVRFGVAVCFTDHIITKCEWDRRQAVAAEGDRFWEKGTAEAKYGREELIKPRECAPM